MPVAEVKKIATKKKCFYERKKLWQIHIKKNNIFMKKFVTNSMKNISFWVEKKLWQIHIKKYFHWRE